MHPVVGLVDLDCEVLTTARQDQRPLLFIPRPGTDAVGQLDLLRVVGRQDPSSAGS